MEQMSSYKKPTETIAGRPFYPKDGRECSLLKKLLFMELCSNNGSIYCLDHHTIETRSTKIQHKGCKTLLPGDILANILK